MTAQLAPEKTDQQSTEPLRLNLGGAGEGYISGRIPGFKTLDLRDGPDTDYVGDVADLTRFANATVHELYASNVLEHFPIPKTLEVLKEWRRVLVPGGKLLVSVPDFDVCVKLYLKLGLTDWVQYLIWGDQKHPLNFHYANFTYATLANLLMKAGFSDSKRVTSFGLVKDASEHKDNIFGMRISLNVEAIA
jgi:predicted SAM-dependent methyltransferase